MILAIRRGITRGLVLLVVTAIVMLPTASSATEQVFMQVPGIPGSSTSAGHVGWIDLVSFTGSAVAPASATTGQQPCQLTVQKQLDKTGPELWLSTVTAKAFTTIDIQVEAPSTTPYVLYDILLTNAEITSIADSSTNLLPMETLTLKAAKVTLSFYAQNPATGAVTKVAMTSFTC